jgi:hypothetical protein
VFRRTVSAALGGCALVIAVASPAAACTPKPRPLVLSSYTVVVSPPANKPNGCDYYAVSCGDAGVQATFRGLAGRDRSGSTSTRNDGDLVGTIRVTRVYGCANAAGRRLHRYDRRVIKTNSMDTRIGSGYLLPAKGNTFKSSTYAFLDDAQPHNCPTGTTAMIYKLIARHAVLTLKSTVPSIPVHTYRAPGVARWVGAVAAPVA